MSLVVQKVELLGVGLFGGGVELRFAELKPRLGQLRVAVEIGDKCQHVGFVLGRGVVVEGPHVVEEGVGAFEVAYLWPNFSASAGVEKEVAVELVWRTTRHVHSQIVQGMCDGGFAGGRERSEGGWIRTILSERDNLSGKTHFLMRVTKQRF